MGLNDDAPLQIEPSRIAVTIVDDDRTTLSLSADATTIAEGGAGTTTDVVVTATLTEAIAGGFMVPFVVAAGTATGGDYTAPAAGMLTFDGTPGETQTITVMINGNDVVEGNQDLSVRIGQIAGLPDRVLAQIDRPADSVMLTIADDDTATLTLSELMPVAEGSASAGGTGIVYP